MDIAIIGCGYVGLAAAKFWQQKMTIMVTATTTTPERLFDLKTVVQKVEVVRGNDTKGLEKVLKGQDIVLLSIARKRNSSYQETYLDTAKTFVDVLKKSSVKQVIYTSSCSVYGNQNGALVNEETAVTPISEGEEILKQTEDVLLGLYFTFRRNFWSR